MDLRWYQKEAVEAAFSFLMEKAGNPVLCMPTGSGKSLVIAELARKAINEFDGKVLVLQHRKELIEQNAAKLASLMPDEKIGIYSAGLKRRETDERVVFAGIQSVYNKVFELAPRHLIIIDEVHLVPHEGEGMYRQLLSDMEKINSHRVIGLTATPFRTGEGSICRKNGIFNKIVYDVPIRQLIAEGYLCNITNKPSDLERDTSGLHKRGGEFIASEVEHLFDSVLKSAVAGIVERTKDRHSVMIFCSSVQHATSVCELIDGAHMVEGNTPPLERSAILRGFANQQIKYLANVDVLTTGFDAPCVDAIAILRATASPGLFAQIVGRGLRTHSSKADCLVLDYGQNIKRHGPINSLDYNKRGERTAAGFEEGDEGKVCPSCDVVNPKRARECECGFRWTAPTPSHEKDADTESQIISDPDYFNVTEVWVTKHEKEGKTPSMRVSYQCDRGKGNLSDEVISEWICLEHTGFARTKALQWWSQHSAAPAPMDVDSGIREWLDGKVAIPKSIKAIKEGRFWRIVEREIEEIPDPNSVASIEELPF